MSMYFKEKVKEIAKIESFDKFKEEVFKLANEECGGNIECVRNAVAKEIYNLSLEKEYERRWGK